MNWTCISHFAAENMKISFFSPSAIDRSQVSERMGIEYEKN